jgi:hypothetical protein
VDQARHETGSTLFADIPMFKVVERSQGIAEFDERRFSR